MAYQSIEAIQAALADSVFATRKDTRKAAGRALGMIVELITFYLLKSFGLECYMAIERFLFEYGQPEIGHKVEFTLHGSTKIGDVSMGDVASMTPKRIGTSLQHDFTGYVARSGRPYLEPLIQNAATIYGGTNTFINAYPDSKKQQIGVYELIEYPFAMFECKRVGIEQGMTKGPQTIEKAKQGAYVAMTASRLQKIRDADGNLYGIFESSPGDFTIAPYAELLSEIVMGNEYDRLKSVVLTVGVVSNHGNWFTNQNQNKEMRVLSQSYDWLLFLTDEGLTTFINETLLGDDSNTPAAKDAFQKTYSAENTGSKKTFFTKSKLPLEADKELTQYFSSNIEKVISWFNVITPDDGDLRVLMALLNKMGEVDWKRVYSA